MERDYNVEKEREELKKYLDNHLSAGQERNPVEEKYKGQTLVFPVGRSIHPLALSLAVFRPVYVYFLVTEESRAYANCLIEGINDYPEFPCKLHEGENCSIHLIGVDNQEAIYHKIRGFYEEKRSDQLLIDITGGLKPVAAAAFMASSRINAEIVYFFAESGETNKDGSEKLYFIKNPQIVSGTDVRNRALEMYRNSQFTLARIQYENMRDEAISDYVMKEKYFMIHLCTTYEYASLFKFEEAGKTFEEAKKDWSEYREIREEQGNLSGIEGMVGIIEQHLEDYSLFLENLMGGMKTPGAKRLMNPTWVLCVANLLLIQARQKAGNEEYDLANLLLYRLTEFFTQSRLCVIGNEQTAVGTWAERGNGLKEKIECLKRANDPVFTEQMHQEIAKHTAYRNKSIYAHGFNASEQKDFEGFQKLVTGDLYNAFAKAEPFGSVVSKEERNWMRKTAKSIDFKDIFEKDLV